MEEVPKMMEQGFIRTTQLSWIICKSEVDGCYGLHETKSPTRDDKYPLPNISDLLDQLDKY